VKNESGSITYKRDTDYEVDLENGKIKEFPVAPFQITA
jgi:hypothetical protein